MNVMHIFRVTYMTLFYMGFRMKNQQIQAAKRCVLYADKNQDCA